MPKYKIQLKPQGAIPRNVQMDVRLTPLGVPPPAEEDEAPPAPPPPECIPECESIHLTGWTSAENEATVVTGTDEDEFPVSMDGGPWTVQVFLQEANPSGLFLCGRPMQWVLGGSLIPETDYVHNNLNGGILWMFGHKADPVYLGNITIQAQIQFEDGGDYVDVCGPIELQFSGEGSSCGDDGGGGEEGCFGSAQSPGNVTFANSSGTVVSTTWTDSGSNAGLPLFWQVVQSLGPTVSGAAVVTTADDTTYQLEIDNSLAEDLTGVQYVCAAWLDEAMTEPYCDAAIVYVSCAE